MVRPFFTFAKMSSMDDYYYLGKIIKPHGFDGKVNTYLDTDDPSFYQELDVVFINFNNSEEEVMDSEIPIGSYVLATKYSDGDPGDAWAVGFYDGFRNKRHYVLDADGNQIRHGGYRMAGVIAAPVGKWLLSVAAAPLEMSPPGSVDLWKMLDTETKKANQ